MKNRLLPIIIALIMLCTGIICAIILTSSQKEIDTVALNEIRANVESAKQNYNQVDSQGFNIIIIEFDGSVKFSTLDASSKSYDEWLNY